MLLSLALLKINLRLILRFEVCMLTFYTNNDPACIHIVSMQFMRSGAGKITRVMFSLPQF